MKRTLALLALLAAPLLAHAAGWEGFFDPFLGDMRDAVSDAKAAGKKGVVVMYEFQECPYCLRMKRDVLSRPEVQKWYHDHFAVVMVDTRGAQTVTGLDGRDLPENEYARAAGVIATPTFDFIGTDGSRAYRYVGGIYDPGEFVLLGRYVASGEYRSIPFARYRSKGR